MGEIQKSVILKLRQEEATFNQTHGNYTINLKKPIRMDQGDVVKMHTAILDTSADGIVTVPDDGTGVSGTKVTLEVALYNTWYENKQNNIAESITTRLPTGGPELQDPTFQRYIACIGKGVPAGTFKVESIRIYPAGIGFDTYGDCSLTFSYVSPMTGGVVFIQRHFDGGPQIDHQRGIAMKIGVNVIGNDGLNSFKCTSTHEYLHDKKIDFKVWKNSDVKYSGEIAVGEVNLEPYIQPVSFVLKSGRYTPGEIATIITDRISILNTKKDVPLKNNPAGSQFCIDNPFLSTVRQIAEIQAGLPNGPFSSYFCPMYPEGANTTIPISHVVQWSSAVLAANTVQPYDMFVGAEQVSLNYDPTLKKLNFDILHFPIYVGASGGSDNAVPGIKFNTAGEVINTYGGAMMTGMYPEQFWSKQMGFSNMIINWETQATSFNAGPETIFPVAVTPVVGKNITNVYDGIDTVCPHNDEFMIPATVTPKINSLTRAIIASREFDVALNDEGYFLIEIGFKFPQNMVGGMGANNTNGSMNSIQGIVGKYFTSDNNFVQSQGQGNITYEHHGESQIITDLSIRILNPDGSQPDTTDLGVKNSIFLEIVKTVSLGQ